MQTIVLFLSCCLIISGCTLNHALQKTQGWLHAVEIVDHHTVSRELGLVLPADSTIYVAFPETHFSKVSDRQVQDNLWRSLTQYFPLSVKGKEPQSISRAMRSARANNTSLMIYPRLIAKVDKVNSLQEFDEDIVELEHFGRDKLRVQILLFDSVSKRLLDIALIDSRSAWLALERKSSEVMFDRAFQQYALSISAGY